MAEIPKHYLLHVHMLEENTFYTRNKWQLVEFNV